MGRIILTEGGDSEWAIIDLIEDDSMRVLVTGATGFAGSHLLDLILNNGHEVVCLVHSESSHQPLKKHERLRAVSGNLLNFDLISRAIRDAKPDGIYHLAGQASPSVSWEDPAATLAINAGGTANLLESARRFGRPRILIVTSADLYGAVARESLPITEDVEPKPQHPYGVSKLAASYLSRLYNRRYDLPVIEARPFNHIGPRQSLGFVVPDFASQLASIKLGMSPPVLKAGNLDAHRDFTDVRDVARAYKLLIQGGEPGELYLICSGQAVSIKQLLYELIDIAQVEVEIAQDDTRLRAAETPLIVGNSEKLTRATGWRPEISLRESLSDTYEYWLHKLADVGKTAS